MVVLDPETAFGSGEHGSTRAALALLERQLRPGDRVLDLGSGSGILAIAAVKLGAARAIGIEIDAEANVVAVRNASGTGARTGSSFSTATPATWRRSSARPTSCCPTSSAASTPSSCPRSRAALASRRGWPSSPGWSSAEARALPAGCSHRRASRSCDEAA